MRTWNPKLLLVLSLVLIGLANAPFSAINPYYYDILITIGINILLAVSLNLVIGYTGQFSLGHAGFMAVGAYLSAWLTLQFGFLLGDSAPAVCTTYLLALAIGGLGAAAAGFLVGVPSLRLRGDYLAIVTLGFSEIIRGVIQNAEPFGAQRGLGGIVQHTNFSGLSRAWPSLFMASSPSFTRPMAAAFWLCAMTRSRPRPWGSTRQNTRCSRL